MLSFKQQQEKLHEMYHFNHVNQMIIFFLIALPIIQIFQNRSALVL